MSKFDIAKFATPLFNISERSYPKEIQFQKIGGGVAIISSGHTTMNTLDNAPLVSTISLGQYLQNNPKVLDEIKESVKYNNNDFDTYIFNLYARDFSNEMDKFKPTLMYTNCWEIKKFRKELSKWIEMCGVPKNCIKKEQVFLKPIDILNILEFCLEVFNIFKKITKNKLNENDEFSFSVKYTFKKTKKSNGKIIITKQLNTIQDIISKDLLTYMKINALEVDGRLIHLQECDYCGDFYFGSKNKKCCSNRCRDLKGKKYEKRKERNAKKISDRNNQ